MGLGSGRSSQGSAQTMCAGQKEILGLPEGKELRQGLEGRAELGWEGVVPAGGKGAQALWQEGSEPRVGRARLNQWEPREDKHSRHGRVLGRGSSTARDPRACQSGHRLCQEPGAGINLLLAL